MWNGVVEPVESRHRGLVMSVYASVIVFVVMCGGEGVSASVIPISMRPVVIPQFLHLVLRFSLYPALISHSPHPSLVLPIHFSLSPPMPPATPCLPCPPSHRYVHRTVTHVAGTPSRPPMSHRHHPEEDTLLPCLMGPDQSGRVAYIPLEPGRFPALPEWEEVRPRPVSTMRGRGPRRDVLHELPGIGCRPACPEHTDASAHRYGPRWKGPAGPSAGGSDALGGSCYALFTGVPSATRLQRGSAADGAVYRRSWDLGWKGAMLCCSAPRALTGCLSGSRLDHARVPPPPAPGPRASRP